MPIDPAEDLATQGIPGHGPALEPIDTGTNIDPHSSVDDYNRVMLQYTQRQMAAFTHGDDTGTGRRNSTTSRSSGQSNTSSVTKMAHGGTGPSPPRTAGTSSNGQIPKGGRA